MRSILSDTTGFFRVLEHRATRLAFAAGMALYLVYHLTGFHAPRMFLVVPGVDTRLIFDRARDVFATGSYPHQVMNGNFNAVFPYPPPAVLIFNPLTFGIRIFMAIWIALMITGLLVAFRACAAGEDRQSQSAWLALGAIALIISDSPVSWDLRAGNSNLIYLGLIFSGYMLLRRSPWIGGTLLSLSISLKLYSALLILWLFRNGPGAASYAAGFTGLVLWLVLPVALFGIAGTMLLYTGWAQQVRMISEMGAYSFIATQQHGPPLVTLRRSIFLLTGAQPEAAITRRLLGGAWAIWVAVLAWYAARALNGGRVVAPSRAALADWVVLLLAPLPLSPWLEPYHMVPVVPGTILCLMVALDRRAADSDRITAGAALLVLLAMHATRVPLPVRGLELLAQFLVLVIALGLLRPRLARGRPRLISPQPGDGGEACTEATTLTQRVHQT
jgi:hypothetical protein